MVLAQDTEADILAVDGLSIAYGATVALDAMTFSFKAGVIHGLVGPNGAGKSTLLDLVSGFRRPTSGRVLLDGRGIDRLAPYQRWRAGVARSFQEIRLVPGLTAVRNLALAVRGSQDDRLFASLVGGRATRLRQEHAMARAQELLAASPLSRMSDTPPHLLSYGQAKILSVLCCLASEPKALLLDEPATGLSPSAKADLLALIVHSSRSDNTIVIVEHDLEFLDGLTKTILFLRAGSLVAVGSLAELRANPAVLEGYLSGGRAGSAN